MFSYNMDLPAYHMTAGSTKSFYIPIFNPSGKRIDATGMTARFSISDYVNYNCTPFVTKNCSVVTQQSDPVAALFVELDAADTIDLYGKFIYQVTAKSADGDIGPMRGILTISPNYDKEAVLSEGSV